MNMVAFTMKLEKTQAKLLDAITKRTNIPKSSLVRQGVEFVIKKYQEEVINPELRKLLDKNLRQDLGLLKRLAKTQ